MRIAATGLSDCGRMRPHNEDAHLVDVEHGVFAVADGMGGHAAGEVASGIAIDALRELLCRPRTGDPDVPELLRRAVDEANRRIAVKSDENPECRHMGTTLVVALVAGPRFWIAHVGDSRAYLLRDGAIQQLTSDHSFVNELVRLGMLSREQAARDPRRNVVTRALGSGTVVAPDIVEGIALPGDLLVLCSDGLNTMLDDRAICEVIERAGSDLERAARDLVEAANAAGGEDNVTVVVLGFEPMARGEARPDTTPPPTASIPDAGQDTEPSA